MGFKFWTLNPDTLCGLISVQFNHNRNMEAKKKTEGKFRLIK